MSKEEEAYKGADDDLNDESSMVYIAETDLVDIQRSMTYVAFFMVDIYKQKITL